MLNYSLIFQILAGAHESDKCDSVAIKRIIIFDSYKLSLTQKIRSETKAPVTIKYFTVYQSDAVKVTRAGDTVTSLTLPLLLLTVTVCTGSLVKNIPTDADVPGVLVVTFTVSRTSFVNYHLCRSHIQSSSDIVYSVQMNKLRYNRCVVDIGNIDA